jgi:hypothetical protein
MREVRARNGCQPRAGISAPLGQKWDDLPVLLTDEVLDTLVPQATYDALPAVIERWFGTIATGIVLEPPDDPVHDEAFAVTIRAIQAQVGARN